MENIKELATALSKAQGQIEGAKKDSDNPFFKSKYADLSSVVEAIKKPLTDNGLSYIQRVFDKENHACVETVILHSSGQSIYCGIVSVPVSKQDAQGFGSAMTYARRYSLSAAFGVAPEDDDGNAAAKAKPNKAFEAPHKPTDGAWESMTPDMRTFLTDLSGEVRGLLNKGDFQGAVEHIEEQKLDGDQKTAFWTKFDSKERSALKKAHAELMEKQSAK